MDKNEKCFMCHIIFRDGETVRFITDNSGKKIYFHPLCFEKIPKSSFFKVLKNEEWKWFDQAIKRTKKESVDRR